MGCAVKPHERAQSIISEFSEKYFFVAENNGETTVCMSSKKYANSIVKILPDIVNAIMEAEENEDD